MSDFSAIFEFLSVVVTTILDFTLDVLCGGLLAASMAAPWRWPQIYYELFYSRSNYAEKWWKPFCFYAFFLTVIDVIKLPFVCIGFCSPIRIYATLYIIYQTLIGETLAMRAAIIADQTQDPDIRDAYPAISRFAGLQMIFFVIADIFSLPFAVLSLIDPWGRQFILIKAIFWSFCRGNRRSTSIRNGEQIEDELLLLDLNAIFISLGCSTVLDLMVFMFSFVILLVPPTWATACKALSIHISRYPVFAFWQSNDPVIQKAEERKAKVGYYYDTQTWSAHRQTYCEEWDGWFKVFRRIIFTKSVHSVIDFCLCPLALIACFAPFRHHQFRQALTQSNQRKQYSTEQDHKNEIFVRDQIQAVDGSKALSSVPQDHDVERGNSIIYGSVSPSLIDIEPSFVYSMSDFNRPTGMTIATLSGMESAEGSVRGSSAPVNSSFAPTTQPYAYGVPAATSTIIPKDNNVDYVEIPDENGKINIVAVPRTATSEASAHTVHHITNKNTNNSETHLDDTNSTMQRMERQSTFAPAEVDDFDYNYDVQLRKDIYYIALLAMADLFLLPMLLPLYITRYRYNAIKDDLFPPPKVRNLGDQQKPHDQEIKAWGHKELFLISRQFILLIFVDSVLFTLTMPILYLTRWRWYAVSDFIKSESLSTSTTNKLSISEQEKLKQHGFTQICLHHNSSFYCLLLKQFFLFLVDLIFIPTLLLILLSGYRTYEIWPIITDPRVYSDGIRVYMVIVGNFFMLIHDFALFIPAMCVVMVIAPYRMFVVVYELFYHEPTTSLTAREIDDLRYDFNIKDPLYRQQESSSGSSKKKTKKGKNKGKKKGKSSKKNKNIDGDKTTILDGEGGNVHEEEEKENGKDKDRVKDSETESEVEPDGKILRDDSQLHPSMSVNSDTSSFTAEQSSSITFAMADREQRFRYLERKHIQNNRMDDSWQHRWDCWLEFFSTLIDIPFYLMGVVVVVTLWRIGELIKNIRGITIAPYHQDETMKSPTSETALKIAKMRHAILYYPRLMRSIVLNEFFSLWIDICSLIPFAIIVATLYRLPELITSLIQVLTSTDPLIDTNALLLPLNVAKNYPMAGTIEPTFSFTLSFNEVGNIDVKNLMNALSSLSSSSTKSKKHFKQPPQMRLHILGKDMWTRTSALFGTFLTGVAKSYLPLNLVLDQSIGIEVIKVAFPSDGGLGKESIVSADSDPKLSIITKGEESLNPMLEMTTKSISVVTAGQSIPANTVATEEEAVSIVMQEAIMNSLEANNKSNTKTLVPVAKIWLKLPAQGMKRTSVLKRLDKFSPETPFIWQIESDASFLSGSAANDDYKKKVVLFRWITTMEEVRRVLESEDVDLTIPLKDPEHHIPHGGVAVAMAKQREQLRVHGDINVAAQQEITEVSNIVRGDESGGSFAPSSTGFVNEFHRIVIKCFYQLLLDIMHFFLFFFTCINPWRFVKMIQCLVYEDQPMTNVRLIEQIITHLNQAERHLQSYRNGLVATMNTACKKEYGLTIQQRESQSNPENPYAAFYDEWNMQHVRQSILQRIRKALHGVHSELDFDLISYQQLIKTARKDMKLFDWSVASPSPIEIRPGSESLTGVKFVPIVNELFDLHDNVMQYWFLRYALWVFSYPTDKNMTLTRQEVECASLVSIEQHDLVAKKIVATKKRLLSIYEYEKSCLGENNSNTTITKAGCCSCKIQSRTIDQCRNIIRAHFFSMLSDRVELMMTVVLFLTAIRFIPTVRELVRHYNYQRNNPVDVYSTAPAAAISMKCTRAILTKQFRLLQHDLYWTLVAFINIILLLATVVGIPAFLCDVPAHIHSIKAVALCANRHLLDFLRNLCEFLSLITMFRTYRMVVKSALYCILLPGAFIGDHLFLSKSVASGGENTTGRDNEVCSFLSGSLAYLAMLIVCIIVSVRINNHNDGVASFSNQSLLIISFVISIILLILALLKVRHKRQTFVNAERQQTYVSDLKRLEISWSHMIGLLLGPFDCVQLSAVILYFFWQPMQGNQSNLSSIHGHSLDLSATSTENAGFGQDYLSPILFWHSEDSNHSSIYRTAVTTAIVFVCGWAVLIALPIAQAGSDEQQNNNRGYYLDENDGEYHRDVGSNNNGTRQRLLKMLKIRNAPIYDAMYVFFSHTISVWIIVTLMRSYSCFNLISGTSGNSSPVLSTQSTVACGGSDHFWSSMIAYAFLSYYIVTSALSFSNSSTSTLQASAGHGNTDIVMMEEVYQEEQRYVRFAEWYTTLIKVAQFLICAACCGGFGYLPVHNVLIIIVIIALIVAIIPWVVPDLANHYERTCNVPGVLPLRSASYVAIAWTAIVCLIRSELASQSARQSSYIFAQEATIYIGWAALVLFAMIAMYFKEKKLLKDWQDLINTHGLDEAVEELTKTYDAALTEANDQRYFLTKPPIEATAVSNNAIRASAAATVVASSSPTSADLLSRYRDQINACRSIQEIAELILHLEELIAVDQLSDEFLNNRSNWVYHVAEAHVVSMAQLPSHIATSALENGSIANVGHDVETGIVSVSRGYSKNPLQLEQEQRRMVQIIMMKRFQAIKSYMTMLRIGFRYRSVSTNLSRDTLSIVLSRLRLPRDICWYIFDFLLNTRELRKVLTFSNIVDENAAVPIEAAWTVKLLDRSSRRGYAASMMEGVFQFIQFNNAAMHDALRKGEKERKAVTGTIGSK